MMYVHGNTDTAFTISPLLKLILISDVQHDFIYIAYIISHNIWKGIWFSKAIVATITSPWLVIIDGVNWWKTQINILMSKSFIGIIQKGRKKYVIGVDLITKDSSLTDEVIVGYLLTLNTSDKLAVIKMKCYLPCLLDLLLVIYLIHLDYIWWIFHSHIK